ncbi:MAG TPA: aerotolerance regulator BatB [Microscillaceae bacterium]|jgi:Ca-activated chloride channel family protein|nr:aerotolerance regulator BatB [Microscillaceae bacterium]
MQLDWFRPWTNVETALLSAFLLAASLHFWRVGRVARHLQVRPYRFFIKWALRTVYFGLIFIALLGPSFGFGKKMIQIVGKDMYVLIDLSASVNATDVSPSRLEKVKFELKNLVDELYSDRIGLIVFAQKAYLHCPLTYDRSALHLYIQSLNTKLLVEQGTNLQAALQLALDRFIAHEQKPGDKYYGKLVVLFTDGEDFGDSPNTVLAEFQKRSIPVFAVGVGTDNGARIPQAEGGFKLEKNGSFVISKLNYQNLGNISKRTGGDVFQINAQNNDMSQLIKTIKSIKGRQLETKSIDTTTNRYAYFLWLALGLIALDIVLIVRVFKI